MSRGFSLIEMLVALAVLSVGLLGAARLSLLGLRDQARAQQAHAVNLLLADLADRIRANPTARAAYDTGTDAGDPTSCDEATPCDPAGMAARDRADFSTAAAAALPSLQPETRIGFEPATGPAAPDRYRIALRWQDARSTDTPEETSTWVLVGPVAGGP